MKPWATLLVCGLLAGGPAGTRAADPPALPRFSQLLATPDRAATGLDRLSSDQLAVLDALVRRDLVAQSAPRRTDAPAPPARFSQRLTDDERRNAGLAALTEAERVRLDAFAERNASVTLARALLSPPTFVPLSVRARVAESAKSAGPEIHGSFTLGMGFGKGYSEKFGGMTLTYEDPARGYALAFSYTESHIKGAAPFYLRDPLHDPVDLPRFAPER